MDVSVERTIHAAPEKVAAFMFDPAKESQWVDDALAVEVLTPAPFGVGSRVRREGGFLGHKIAWTAEVTEFDPGHRIRMNTLEGTFHGDVTYEVRPTAGGSIALVHCRGGGNLPVPGMGWMVKRQVEDDLKKLAAVIQHQFADS